MALPVISRMAAIMSSLMNENPISSVAAIVPRNALLNRDTFTITNRPASFALYDDEPDCGIVSFPISTCCSGKCRNSRATDFSFSSNSGFNNAIRESAITRVISARDP